MVAGGVVDHRARLNLSRRAAVEGERAAGGDAGLLACPYVGAPVQTDDLDAFVFVESKVEQNALLVDSQPAGRQLDGVAVQEHMRALTHAVLAAREHRPEALTGRPELDPGSARHQLVAEDGHIAPALQGSEALEQGHPDRLPDGGGRYA